MLDFTKYEWLSFDCYGTIVDWETGIYEAVRAVFASHGVRRGKDEILRAFADAEPGVQMSGEFLDYHRVLRDVMQIMAWQASIRLRESEAGTLHESLPLWPVFPEARAALGKLKARYKLAIISNVDDDLFELTQRQLGVEFDAVVTSQQAGSYKPDLRNFDLAQERMGVEKDGWLHVAESLYHDIGPANRIGIDSIWVNRASRGGGTRRTDVVPTRVVPELATLAELASAT